MREDLKGRPLSFTEIAKLVGENWQSLSPTEKEPYESQAFALKDKYNNELAEYKKTEMYQRYAEYLSEFKAKHTSSQQPPTDGMLLHLFLHYVLVFRCVFVPAKPPLITKSYLSSIRSCQTAQD